MTIWEGLEELKAKYVASPSYEDRLGILQDYAIEHGISKHAIIAKLANEGVYEKRKYMGKHNKIPISKEECETALELYLGLDLPSIGKLSKRDMLRIMTKLREIELDHPPFDTLRHWEIYFGSIVDDI